MVRQRHADRLIGLIAGESLLRFQGALDYNRAMSEMSKKLFQIPLLSLQRPRRRRGDSRATGLMKQTLWETTA
jgi:hypothetical protein